MRDEVTTIRSLASDTKPVSGADKSGRLEVVSTRYQELHMVIWHSTEDAPRTPAEVFPNDKVVLWIGSYPIELGQSVTVELRVMNKDSNEKKYSVEAEWRYNDYGKNNSYWAAIIGPFKPGETVEYRITGVAPNGSHHSQVAGFSVIDRKKSGQH